LWAIGTRLESGTQADVEQAITDGRIIRTWPMRGTIHFVPSEDAKWMLKLSASRLIASDARRLKQLELTVETMTRCQGLFSEALSGGKRLTRSEMMSLLEDAGIRTDGQRGYHILWYCSQVGTICPGPMQGKQQTFVLLDEWSPEARELSHDDALAELAERYFFSHGPATVHDFARWSGLTVTDARKGIQLVGSMLISDEIDGQEYWMKADAALANGDDDSRIYLLAGFDEYIIGYKDRSAVVDAEHMQKIVPGSNGIFQPTIVIGGQNVGTWKRRLRKNAVDITLNPFMPLDNLEERVLDAARSYSAFIGLPLGPIIVKDTA
jgi:hypothetical protein